MKKQRAQRPERFRMYEVFYYVGTEKISVRVRARDPSEAFLTGKRQLPPTTERVKVKLVRDLPSTLESFFNERIPDAPERQKKPSTAKRQKRKAGQDQYPTSTLTPFLKDRE